MPKYSPGGARDRVSRQLVQVVYVDGSAAQRWVAWEGIGVPNGQWRGASGHGE